MKKLLLLLSGIVAAGAFAVNTVGPVTGADHGDAPLTKANHAEDIADVYAFAGSGDNVVFVMTVNGLAMPGETPAFDTAGLYQFQLDNNGDAIPDVAYNVTFGEVASNGQQNVSVKRATGAAADEVADNGAALLSGKTTAGTGDAVVNSANGAKLFAGLRDDPFFFDLNAFKAGLAFRNPGNNFFKGLNVNAIVLELPKANFLNGSNTSAGVWAVTSKGGNVIDRMGRPAIATVFIPADQKDAFNNTKPVNDVASWKSTLVSALQSLKSDPALADALLPDILTFDTSKSFAFLNGRGLSDDVIDGELQLITGSKAASDNVANDSSFSTSFPYVGPANTAAAPTAIPAAAPTTAPAVSSSPVPVATRPPAVVTAPNTGTGDGTSGSNNQMWIIIALVTAAVAVAGTGAVTLRNRK